MNEPVFNLVDEAWIPMRRRSGCVETVPPWRVTDDLDGDPFVAFAWPRPDFNGAAHEFLIGLLATTSAPGDDDDWAEEWNAPPSPEALHRRFSEVRYAFDLDGAGPRFMQDLEPLEATGMGGKGVSALLIDSPGDQTRRRNADLFVKRDQVDTLCRAAAAMALFTLNCYAPSGGAGHRTSLRGGGPLTTLVISDHHEYGPTLWGRLWPNVETREQIRSRGQFRACQVHCAGAAIFPWLGPTRTSNLKQGGVPTSQADVDPLQIYWGMPRRIRLLFEPAEGRLCDCTGTEDSMVVARYATKNYGTHYTSGFDHPMAPYYRQSVKKTEWLPVHPRPGGISYRMYPGCVVPSRDGLRRPAAIVSRRFSLLAEGRAARLLAYGYDMDNMKARGWLEGEMPLIDFPPRTRREIAGCIQLLTTGAESVQTLLVGAIKDAHWERRRDAKGDFSFVGERLYRDTEAAFHDAVGGALACIDQQPEADDATLDARRRWSDVLRRAGLALFREYAPSEGLEDRNMHRHAKARHFLTLALAGHGGKGRSLFERDLNIPSPKRRTEVA